jgi:hypothetical protein
LSLHTSNTGVANTKKHNEGNANVLKTRWIDTLPPLETVLTPEVIAIALMAAQTLWSQSLMAPTLALKYELRAGAGIVAWRKQVDPDGKTQRRDADRHFRDGLLVQRDLWHVLDKIRYARMVNVNHRCHPTAALVHLRDAEAILRERHHEREKLQKENR